MVRRWDQWRDPWDREYAMRGRLWRPGSQPSPLAGALPDGTLVLDLGCGDGKHAAALAAASYGAVGLDRSRHALDLALKHVAAAWLQGDVRRLPIRDAAFAAVAARYVWGALDEGDRAIACKEAWRVLGPGGTLHVEEFASTDFRADQGPLVAPGTRQRNQGIRTHYFERHEMAALAPVEPVTLDAIEWTQRTHTGPRGRAAWRASWRKQA